MAFEKIVAWWQRNHRPDLWHVKSVVGTTGEVPDKLPNRVAVIVGTKEKPKWLVLDCPCGKGHRVKVTLDPANNPHWKVLQEIKLSVYPSIDDRDGDRRCHFMITNGNIIWVKTA